MADSRARWPRPRGTHLAALVEADTDGQAFLRALGFRERGERRTLMIRRGPSLGRPS